MYRMIYQRGIASPSYYETESLKELRRAEATAKENGYEVIYTSALVYKESIHWDSWKVRDLCIEYDYYSCGTLEDYDHMLDFVRTHKPTNKNLQKVAEDIVLNSDMSYYGQTFAENVSSVMFELSTKTVNRFYDPQ